MESAFRKPGVTGQPTTDKNENFNHELVSLRTLRETREGMIELDKNDFPGRLFIVEGIDGSGKSTQLALLHPALVLN